ncbi:SusC/RagA family TonB-linked outer membrane protein [Mucilaginibacter terrigena]|uniref:SusC/RagA family TonB-linked outer membrane protein n=1 Tax=Mucilaginibacter terrigena TaxID=2492395 RepID=A0A4Q5LKQ6_9SPHI|nr:SusC/RagA family TonB-linked outer membrane protein [Mucilaginibacter terrigena]RYU89410.1 SusC/RagA family TonB-linked outer membrane protein [Mucilaginibacter terrigena]
MKKLLLVSLCFLMLCITQVYAQNRTITGTVTSKDDGLPLPGVSVTVTGTTVGTQTNASGKFSLNVPATAKTLSFSFIGFDRQSVSIGSGDVINIVLASTANQLSEVVVTAGGLEARKKEQGYSSTTIKPAALTASKPVNAIAGLNGKVAGLRINATSSGVNPNYRVVLRGMRSLKGNNDALIVVDNVIVPNAILSNINPEDIDDIQVLNGAGAAALYGSEASNGAIIITTKKGTRGQTSIRVSNTTTIEQVSFYPKFQTGFGSGSSGDIQAYIAYENQQFGPAYDGVVRPVGLPLENGDQQMIPYSYKDAKNKFWQNGLTNQTDFNLSSGNDRSTIYTSGQYANVTGTTPGDKFNRANLRVNGTQKILDNLNLTYTVGYTQNRYDITNQTATIYNNLLNSPGQIDITDYSDWRNNEYANPNGYFNAYYNNPYFIAGNYRQKTRNDYLVGNVEMKYNPTKWLDFTYRVGITTRNTSQKVFADKFAFTDYTKTRPELAGTYKVNDILGSNQDYAYYQTRINSDFLVGIRKSVDDFSFKLILGASIRNDNQKDLTATVNGLVVPGVFNLGNSTNTPTASGSQYNAHQEGVYGDFTVGYKDYLFLHATGRNDWVSVLLPKNRSFFYPAADVSFVVTDAFKELKDIKGIDFIKIRGGISKVGQVNLPGTFGAYSLDPTFGQGAGYPYNGAGGHTISNTIVSTDLKPEITKGYELGFDANFWDNRVSTKFTYFSTKTDAQTIETGVSTATGFNTYRTNVGQTSSKGYESSVNLTAFRNRDWDLTIGANYTHITNNVESISADIQRLSLGVYGGGAGSYAVAGQPFPVIMGHDYTRDDQGRIIVDPITGYPTASDQVTVLGNAQPKDVLAVNLSVKYKGLRFSALAEYRGGYNIYNAAAGTFDFSGSSYFSGYYNRDRFVIPNSVYLDAATGSYVPNTNITVRDGGTGYWTDDPRSSMDINYVYSGAFWKIREAALSYDLPKSLLGKTKAIKAVTLSVQGRNLFLFTPKSNAYTDPEYSDGDGNSSGNAIGLTNLGQTPPSRYFGGTISVTF